MSRRPAGQRVANETPCRTIDHAGGRPRGWVRRLGGYLLVYKRNLIVAFAGAIVGSVAQVVVPLVERQIVDNVIVRHSSPLAPWVVALLGLGVVTFVGAYFRRYRGGRVALDVQYDLATPCKATCSASTSRISTACRPASSWPAPIPTRRSYRASSASFRS